MDSEGKLGGKRDETGGGKEATAVVNIQQILD